MHSVTVVQLQVSVVTSQLQSMAQPAAVVVPGRTAPGGTTKEPVMMSRKTYVCEKVMPLASGMQ
jgi:hypothetical protein